MNNEQFLGRFRKYILPLLGAGVMLTITFFINRYTIESVQISAADEFNRHTNDVTQIVQTRMNSYVNSMYSVRGFFAGSIFVTREEWTKFIDTLDFAQNYPGIAYMAYAPIIDASTVSDFEREINSSQLLSFTYRVYPQDKKSGKYAPILYLEPAVGFENSFGFDLYSDYARAVSLEAAVSSGNPTLSPKLRLTDKSNGFSVYMPIYKSDPVNPDQVDPNQVSGFVTAAFRSDELFREVFGFEQEPLSELQISIYSSSQADETDLLYRSVNNFERLDPNLIRNQIVNVANRPWLMVFEAREKYGQSSIARQAPILVYSIGIVLSIILGLLIYYLLEVNNKAFNIAGTLTNKFKQSEEHWLEIVHNLPLILLIVNKEGLITLAEGRNLDRLNMASNDLVNKDIKTIFGDYPEILNEIELCIAGKEVISTHKINGYTFEIRYSAIKVIGVATEVLCALVDISDKELTLSRLQAKSQELQQINKTMIDRELKMAELKDQLKQIQKEDGTS